MSVAGTGGFKVVSQGIAAALVATSAGLMVAIYAVIAYNYFVARINGIAMQYKLYCEEFLAALDRAVADGLTPEQARRQTELAAKMTWDANLKRVMTVVEKQLAEKPPFADTEVGEKIRRPVLDQACANSIFNVVAAAVLDDD